MIKARIKNSLELDQEFLEKSSCLIGISVGQHYHEKESFAATIDLVNEKFYSCSLMIADSLQRHTMALYSTRDADYFHDFAVQEGSKWLSRNEKYYQKLKNLVSITRWDDWLNHPEYLKFNQKIKNLIKSDDNFQYLFKITIDKYLSKCVKRANEKIKFDYLRAKEICSEYLIEECAALCLFPDTNCNFELYPVKHNFVMVETRKRFIYLNYPNILQALSLVFNKRPNMPSQSFQHEKSSEISLA